MVLSATETRRGSVGRREALLAGGSERPENDTEGSEGREPGGNLAKVAGTASAKAGRLEQRERGGEWRRWGGTRGGDSKEARKPAQGFEGT